MLAIPNIVLFLMFFSLPFAVVSARSGRQWTLALPAIVWGGLAALQMLGITRVYAGSSSLVVGALIASGTLFALAGLLYRANRKPRQVA